MRCEGPAAIGGIYIEVGKRLYSTSYVEFEGYCTHQVGRATHLRRSSAEGGSHVDSAAMGCRAEERPPAVGLHASLPLMNLVQRRVISFLRGTKTGDLWGRPLPGVTRWDPGFPGVVNKAAR